MYTLVKSAKANNLEPYDYLLKVLSHMRYYGKNLSNEKLDELMP